jgi:hypothetical protein
VGIGVLASLATIAAFAIDFIPDDSCTEIGARLDHVRAQPNISFEEYLSQANLSSEGYGGKQLRQRVNGVFADVAIDGYKGSHLTLNWSMFEAGTGRIVREAELRNQPALDIEPSTCQTLLRASVWTPVVQPGRRFVRLILVDDRGQVLAEARTNTL